MRLENLHITEDVDHDKETKEVADIGGDDKILLYARKVLISRVRK